MPTTDAQRGLITHLRERGILAVFHYQALNVSAMGQRFGGRPGQCPVAEDVSGRLVRLPLFADLSESDSRSVIDAVTSFHP
jgi:dTDP-4-amino-4,6-dideoxygalactose transaminase